MTSSPRPVLTARYTAALDYARVLHAGDIRKGTTIPYFAHLMSVSALVLEHGGSEDHAIAALLHDAAEDHGGEKMLDAVRAEFGDTVAAIVRSCSDSLVEDRSNKAPWCERKQSYLAHIADMSADAALVSAADKVHNARAVLADYRRHGDELWTRFNRDAGCAGVCWYYGGLAREFQALLGHPDAGEDARALATELSRTVEALHAEVRRSGDHPELDEQMRSFDAT